MGKSQRMIDVGSSRPIENECEDNEITHQD